MKLLTNLSVSLLYNALTVVQTTGCHPFAAYSTEDTLKTLQKWIGAMGLPESGPTHLWEIPLFKDNSPRTREGCLIYACGVSSNLPSILRVSELDEVVDYDPTKYSNLILSTGFYALPDPIKPFGFRIQL